MRIYHIFLLSGLFVADCNQAKPAKKQEPHSQTDTLREPDIQQLRAGLWQYFDRHKHEDIFDTADYTYNEYWGPVHYPPYEVKSGYLFSPKQVHAIIYYCDEYGVGLFVWKKNGDIWKQIYADSTMEYAGINAGPEIADWNGDKVPDITIHYPSAGTMSVIDKKQLWLMDETLDTMHEVKEFMDVENPELDNMPGHIKGGYYHHGEFIKKYKFKGHRLIKVSEEFIEE